MKKLRDIANAVGGKWKKATPSGPSWVGLDTTTKSGKELRVCQDGDGSSEEDTEVYLFSSPGSGVVECNASFSTAAPQKCVVAFVKEMMKQ